MRSKLVHLRARALAAVLALAVGCGGDDNGDGDGGDDGAATGDNELAITGQDDLTWDTESLTASAGTITVTLTCESAVNHDFVIEDTDDDVVACEPGATETGTVDLEAGEYTYICAVPGHEATMRGTLTVT